MEETNFANTDITPHTPEASLSKESEIHHSDITMIFGQGPVQEYSESQGELGRTGLNFLSRLNALAGAEMLIHGKTDKVILSGGPTGALKEATEADLMADIIRRRITTAANSATDPSEKLRLQNLLDNGILTENRSQDTIENFVNVISQYIDSPDVQNNAQMTLLGIGYHAKDTFNNTGVGRLEKLADIFGIEGQVISAEAVLKKLVIEAKADPDSSAVAKEMQRLISMAHTHEVAQLKSRQEEILVKLLDNGDWIANAKGEPKVAHITNPSRLRHMLLSSDTPTTLLQKSRSCSAEEAKAAIENGSLNELQQIAKEIAPLVPQNNEWQDLQKTYSKVKSEVLSDFEQLRNQRIRQLLNDDHITDQEIEHKLDQLRVTAAELRNQLREVNTQIEAAQTDGIRTEFIQKKADLLQQLDDTDLILKEDKYQTDNSYMMLYGKGEDPRKK